MEAARFDWLGRDIVIATMMLPTQVRLIPEAVQSGAHGDPELAVMGHQQRCSGCWRTRPVGRRRTLVACFKTAQAGRLVLSPIL